MAAAERAHDQLIWEPQPGPQTHYIRCPVFEVVYGGARGGGKTDGSLGDWIDHSDTFGPAAKGLFIRRNRTQLVDTIERAAQLFLPIGAKWKEVDKTFVMAGGGVVRFAYLERDRDAEQYQGHSYSRIYAEELTNFADQKPIRKMFATLRSAAGAKVGFRGTCNPGGPGHQWVKQRYIDPAPQGYAIIRDDDGNERVFIPAKLRDNPALLSSDPQYVARLKQSGSAALVKAWLDGDWSIVEGAFFDCWSSDLHVVKPFEVPATWLRFRSMDWGFAAPFSVGWWAVSDGSPVPDGRVYPRGCLVRYREWYGASEPNVGLRLTAEEVARGIKERSRDEAYAYSVCDPAMAQQDGGPSIMERMHKGGVMFRPGDNARVPRGGHMGGWDQMRGRMVGEDGQPMLVTFSTCADSIRTIPALQHDPDKPEDLDTDGEDHAADDWRYACMSRPYVRTVIEKPKPRTLTYSAVEQNGAVTIKSNIAIRDIVRNMERARKRANG